MFEQWYVDDDCHALAGCRNIETVAVTSEVSMNMSMDMRQDRGSI